MFNKVNDKDKEYNSNNAMRPLFIAIFMVSLALISIFYVWTSGGFGISYKGLKPASERRKPKTSNITSNVPITSNIIESNSNIIESNSNSNEVIEPTSNETSNRQVEPTSNSNSNKVEPTSNPTSNEVVPEKGEAAYKIVHKYEQLDGTYLDEEITDKGTIDSEVTPELKGKDGYKNPTIQKVKIKEDGTTVIEYVYNLEKYTLTVNNYEFIEEGNVSGEYKYGSKVTLTAKERDNHEFTKWSTGDTTSQITITITKNTNIDLIYDQLSYIVNYDGNGYEVNPETIIVNKGNELGTLPTPVYPVPVTYTNNLFKDSLGFRFVGWYTELDGGIKVDESFVPESDITLYARFEDPCKGLYDDDWDKIGRNIASNNTYYPVGCIKKVDLDFDSDSKTDLTTIVRVANNSTPEECNSDDYSQTACGTVFEFEDVLTSYNMRDDSTNLGGWKESKMRSYVNNYIYNALPENLRNVITPTKVVSGHGSNSGEENFVTDDKLFLLDVLEYGWNGSTGEIENNVTTKTRMLDIYQIAVNGITTNGPFRTKRYTTGEYSQAVPIWTRSVQSQRNDCFYRDSSSTSFIRTCYNPNGSSGVSPLFKVGEPRDKNSYNTIKFNANGGELNYYIKELDTGSTIDNLPIMKKTPFGKTFAGWYTELNGGIKVDESFVPNSDIILYARYADNCEEFRNDSWQTISNNVANQVNYYPLGCTKTVELDLNHDGTTDKIESVRITNNTLPEACNNSEYSQTSCGFVLEFERVIDVIDKVAENGNAGGWPNSIMREYVNENIYDSLPEDLRELIIPTLTYSSHGNYDNHNFSSVDKMYFPSVYEITNSSDISYDAAEDTLKNDKTRMLDYYSVNIEQNNEELYVKYINNFQAHSWLTRSSRSRNGWSSDDKNSWITVSESGAFSDNYQNIYSYVIQGVSPLFRLGKKKNNIIFDSNGGTNLYGIALENGDAIENLPTPVAPPGFEFVGWYTELNGGTKIENGYIPTDDMTLYARYIDICEEFRNDSWQTISNNVAEKLDYYPLGCRREISLDMDHDGENETTTILRISNNTMPETCYEDGNSQTACGFVVEFEDIISQRALSKNRICTDDCRFDELRYYLNNDVYDALPDDLQKVIDYTTVVNGYEKDSVGQNIHKNIFVDKLYLLSEKELFGYSSRKIEQTTRQLDYYAVNEVSNNHFDAVKKKDLNGEFNSWWLRTIERRGSESVSVLETTPDRSTTSLYIDRVNGISPAFRISSSNKKYYTVTYDSNGGLEINKQAYIQNSEIDELPIPISSDESLKFEGWYTGLTDGIKIEPGYRISEDITLYAKYEDSCKDFATASWSTIQSNVSNRVDYYGLGCTKNISIDLDNNGTYETEKTLRVINNTVSNKCLDENFSETACGFVVEFEDIINKKKFNSTNTNTGGWRDSELRTYINNDIYNSLPQDLKNIIIPTKVLSSYSSGNANYISSDKLYLLEALEILETENTTITESHTKQIDYYKSSFVKTASTDASKKKYGTDYDSWWLRGAYPNETNIYSVSKWGSLSSSLKPNTDAGVSPSFRISTSKVSITLDANGGTVDKQNIIGYVGSGVILPTPVPPVTKKFDGWYTNDNVKVSNYYEPTTNVTLTARYVDGCTEFENDSWDTISSNISDKADYYPIGCTKTVSLDLNDDGENETSTKVRIINNTNPDSCSINSFSQSACGFVLEFENTLFNKQMNSTNTNEGGWETSDLRNYLNSTFYSKLPNDLKNVIVSTNNVSGYNNTNDTKNFETQDYIYLLSSYEILGNTYSDNVTDSYTRQLDYYSYGSTIKTKKNISGSNNSWWLRSAISTSNNSYSIVSSDNNFSVTSAQATANQGVSPVFRIGTKSSYYIILDSNGGTTVSNKNVNQGKNIGNLPTPVAPTGYKFIGWYTEKNGGEQITSDYIPDGDMIIYAQYVSLCDLFANDSWDTIASNISTDVRYYTVGCKKEISLDMDKDGVGETTAIVRISNNTNTSKCSRDNYSQTACGFVLEFEDIINKKQMNSTNTSVGGWKNTELRKYLNNDLYDALPSELRPYITPTRVITGHGTTYSEADISSVDMLYLLSTVEINEIYDYDTLTANETRTLDYYNLDSATKKKNYESSPSDWYLRSPFASYSHSFEYVTSNGTISYDSANYSKGVSPAFRLDTTGSKYYRVNYNVDGKETYEYYNSTTGLNNMPEPFVAQKKFVGWYTGLTDGIKIEEGYIPTSNMTLYARFEDACEEFENDSWQTISENILNDSEYYPVGCTKDVDININNRTVTHKVRIVNNTTSDSCSSDNYSQTACGVVLGFTKNIESQPFNSVDKNVGGWKNSKLRTYANTNMYNYLPDELKNLIIPTKVISGHGSTTGETNLVSTDYMYLPSSVELYGTSVRDTLSANETKQFDLYRLLNVSTSNYTELANETSYYLRSASSSDTTDFNYVNYNGKSSYIDSSSVQGVIPTFRIGVKEKEYYSVAYDSNGGNNVPFEIIESGSEISTLPVTTAPLKIFDGWYTELTGGIKVEDGYVPTGNVTLYARYRELCDEFKNDSWDTIVSNVADNSEYYPLGCTKDITLTSGKTSTVRIINTSTPDECSGDNYSQTACGFVIGFDDIVDYKPMNLQNVNAGGWASSYMRNWLHINTYYDLPSDLRNNIISTKVISGHGSSEQNNYNTIDYIYLLSNVEVWGSAGSDSVSIDQTRQLDYYSANGVTSSNYGFLNDKSTSRFLRSPYSSSTKDFNMIFTSGWMNHEYASYEYGIMPVFRLGSNGKTHYAVVYETYDGTSVPMSVVEVGNSIDTLPVTSHESKTFEGWYTAKRNGTKVSNGFTPTDNTILYARFVDECTEFEEDSWDTIKTNVTSRTDYYPLGCKKEVELDLDHDGTAEITKNVRIANNTKPNECNSVGYSQTACGFVLEFEDVIEKKKMNNEYSNKGGFPSSLMATYLKDDLYNALPNDLKLVIEDTYTLSGYGTNDSSNFKSLDKLYLPSSVEIYGSTYNDTVTTSNTRQLDYYKELGVTTSNYSKAQKKYNNSSTEWWLRSASSYSDFGSVGSYGSPTYNSASSSYTGVSPSFRIDASSVKYYKVSYNTNSNQKINDLVITAGEGIDTLPTVEVSMGKIFDGWYTGLTDGYKVSDGFIPSGSIVLYARYIDLCKDFENASWDTISSNVSSDVGYYGIGCEKVIDLDFNHDGTAETQSTIRVANNTTPDTCNSDNYSQTACGFVVEFKDVIKTKEMNSEYTNEGGFPSSLMATYLKDDLYNALPNDLKLVIEDTYTLSGYGTNDSSNFKSLDKLYLLSSVEVYGSIYNDTVTTSNTRQLDYYKELGVTQSSYSKAKKKYNGYSTNWWLRSAISSSDYGTVSSSGYATNYSATSSNVGVSPAFRVGTSQITYNIVSYNTNTSQTIKDSIVKAGSSIGTLPTVTVPKGKVFDGWYTGLTDGYKVSETFVPTGNITLYARYIDLCKGFENASWDTIITNTNTKMDYYGVECSKSVDLDYENDGEIDKTLRVRIANNTLPEECSGDDYSQTACGLVLEFEDIIDIKEMSSSTVGGWSNASLRQYVNNDIYNALPSDLKSIIIPTKVVSGYTAPDTINSNSLDKLYPLSLVEIYNLSNVQIDTLTSDYTRQLDLYSELGVTERNFNDIVKMYESENTSYWLRTPYLGSNYFAVQSNGDLNIQNSASTSGVSLAFRIGTSTTEYYTVSYNSNGGGYVGESIVEAGKSVSKLPTPIPPDGQGFVGWYTSLTGGEKVSDGYTPSGNVTFYARYEDVCKGFDTASWSTISSNINNQLDYYGVGCKKAVELDLDQDGTTDKTLRVRIANNTLPEECSDDDHSQTACGFVLEFDEIIDVKPMNESDDGSGGYPATTLKSYIDNTLYNALPSDLKDAIIDTKAYYSYSGSDTDNFVSTDKLYLPSVVEVYGIPYLDTINSRQLDYYSMKGLSENGNYSVALKKNGNTYGNWWLSTPYDGAYVYVTDNEFNPIYFDSPSEQQGVSPLFRIG